jgi:hypothetical protein
MTPRRHRLHQRGCRALLGLALALWTLLPARPQGLGATPAAPSASAVARCGDVAAGPAAAACSGPALRFAHGGGRLPLWPLGQPYPRVTLITGGLPPYTIEWLRGQRPAELHFNERDGTLVSTQAAAVRRDYEFAVEVRDSAQPPQIVRQTFRLSQAHPPPPGHAASGPPAPQPPIDRDAAPEGSVLVYRLTEADLDQLAPKPAPLVQDEVLSSATGKQVQQALQALGFLAEGEPLPQRPVEAPQAAEPDGKPPDYVYAMLKPLVDVEFPTRTQFEAALLARQCAFHAAVMQIQATKAKSAVVAPPYECDYFDRTFPNPPISKLPRDLQKSFKASFDAFATLLPETLREAALTRASKVYPLREIQDYDLNKGRLLAWQEAPCACVEPLDRDVIYGLYQPWHTDAKAPVPRIDFSAFHRISVFGVQFDNQGNYQMFPDEETWKRKTDAMSHLALRHGTHLDLVVHRAAWAELLAQKQPDPRTVWTRAAENAVDLLDAKRDAGFGSWQEFTRLDWVRPFLPWEEPGHVFDGITVFFDATPTGDAGQRYRQFLAGYVEALMEAMRRRQGRHYTLNIVAPDDQIGVEGAFDWSELLHYLKSAERTVPARARQASDAASAVQSAASAPWSLWKHMFPGSAPVPDITLRVLVLLREPTTNYKKILRAQADRSEVVKGEDRLAVLNSLVPVIFLPDGAVPAPAPEVQRRAEAASAPPPPAEDKDLPQKQIKQLQDDLAYFEWSFGGVALWGLPREGTAQGATVDKALAKNFPGLRGNVGSTAFCRWVCPNRNIFHLSAELSLMMSLGLLVLYRQVNAVRQYGGTARLGILGLFALTLFLAGALLACDPGLHALREGNSILIGVLAGILVVTLWFAVKPRVPHP